MSRILVDGARYEVRVGGDGPPILLLHGFTGRGANWGPFLPRLRRTFTTIQVDLLGHGRSDAPADPARHAVDRQAADMAGILHAVAVGPADVLGYSFGARVALTLAVAAPHAVRRLVLESPSAGIADPAERTKRRAADEALANDIERDGIAAFVARWESLPLFAAQAAMPETRRRRIHAERLHNSAPGLAGSLRGAGQGVMTPLHHRLASVSAPTLVVCGGLDPVRPRAEQVAAGIPGARLKVVEEVGHAPHLEAPARFCSVVLPFVTALETPVPSQVHKEVAR